MKVIINKIQTDELCNLVIVEISKSSRGASTSPACGPLPVTKVPIAIAINAATIWARESREILTWVDDVRTCG